MRGKRTIGAALCCLLVQLAGCAPAAEWGHGIMAGQTGGAALIGGSGQTVAAVAGPAELPSAAAAASAPPLETTGGPPEPVQTIPPKPEKPAAEKAGAAPAEASKPPAENSGSAKTPAVKRKTVALTFDDGPDGKYTPMMLDILEKHGVKATFFLVGTQVEKYPKVAERIAAEGHDIGNHSWSHQDLAKLDDKQLDGEILKTQDAIEKAAGTRPDLVRAPNGSLSDPLLSYLHDRHLFHVYWTVDPRDWAGTSVAAMRENVRKHTKPGGIILLHSFGGRKNALDHTLQLLPLIIEDLQKAGYEFCTVDEMIAAKEANASAIR